MQLLCCCILYAIGSNIKNIEVSLDPSPAPYYFLLPHEF